MLRRLRRHTPSTRRSCFLSTTTWSTDSPIASLGGVPPSGCSPFIGTPFQIPTLKPRGPRFLHRPCHPPCVRPTHAARYQPPLSRALGAEARAISSVVVRDQSVRAH